MASPPQTVSDVLCREVGARHPDGALQQIRTMKRVLRSHYRAQKRLEAFGVNGVTEAVTHLTALRARIDALKAQQKKQAQAHVDAADEALQALQTARETLRANARSWDEVSEASSAASSSAASIARTTGSDLEVVDAVRTEIDELRLELWAERTDTDSSDPSSDASFDASFDASSATSAAQASPKAATTSVTDSDDNPSPRANRALDALAARMQTLRHQRDELRTNNRALRSETATLQDENQRLRSRIQSVEQQLQQQQFRLQAIAEQFCSSEPVDA